MNIPTTTAKKILNQAIETATLKENLKTQNLTEKERKQKEKEYEDKKNDLEWTILLTRVLAEHNLLKG